MKKNIIILIIVLALVAFAGLQLYSFLNEPVLENNHLVEESEKVLAKASWAIWYPDFDSMMKNTDLVIVGNVVTSQLNPNEQEYTLHKIIVQEVIKDAHNEVKVGNTIFVSQFGGISVPPKGGIPVQVEFRDSPLMKEDETSLLFLKRGSDGLYGGISPQTRFIVEDSKVYWLGAVYKNRVILMPPNMQIDGLDVTETVSMLRQLTSTSN